MGGYFEIPFVGENVIWALVWLFRCTRAAFGKWARDCVGGVLLSNVVLGFDVTYVNILNGVFAFLLYDFIMFTVWSGIFVVSGDLFLRTAHKSLSKTSW